MTKTLGYVLDSHRGLGPGFDFLRVSLAVSIVFCHSFLLTGNDDMFRGSPLWFGEYALVPMFFALSGFLIAGSAQRLDLKNFLLNRGLRIVPALAVDVVVCALIIGPIMTTALLSDYFTSPMFFKYFLNIIGWIHYILPGVFTENPTHRVNGALWTVPWEIYCYLIMSFLMVTSIIKSPKYLIALILLYLLGGIIAEFMGQFLPDIIGKGLRFFFVWRGTQLVLAFLLGILAYQLRNRIPKSAVLFSVCCVVAIVAIFVLDTSSIESVPNRLIVIPALVYITIFIGLSPMYIPSFFRRGDYSYGIYLYHDPFLQVLISLAPGLFLIPKFGAVALFAIGILASISVAVFSWHLIEKPILGMRRKFSFVAKTRRVADEVTLSTTSKAVA